MSYRKFGYFVTGYWIGPEGEVVPVDDHFVYLLDNPEEFGIEEDEIEGISFTDKEKRVELLLRAMRNNWIRVRRTGGMSSIECWELTDWTLARIQMFCKKINAWKSDTVTINEISKGNSYPIMVQDLFSEDAMRRVSSKRIDSVLRKETI